MGRKANAAALRWDIRDIVWGASGVRERGSESDTLRVSDGGRVPT